MAKTYEVVFECRRLVTVYLEAEDEDDVHEFLEETGWDPIEDLPEAIDADVTDPDDTDYSVNLCPGIAANYAIVDGALVEVER